MNSWRKLTDTTLTWKLWTMILMKQSGNWNKRLTKSVPHPSGYLSVGSIEKSVRNGWKTLWPCKGIHVFLKALLRTNRKRKIRPKCIMGDSSCSFTFITNSCVLCPQTDSDGGIYESAFIRNSPLNIHVIFFLTNYMIMFIHICICIKVQRKRLVHVHNRLWCWTCRLWISANNI